MGKLLGIISGNSTNQLTINLQFEKKITYENVSVFSLKENKFKDDALFYEDDDYIIITEGVILNKNILLQSTFEHDLQSLIISRYLKYGNLFFEIFKGSFCGFFYDKKEDKAIIFTNHFGDKQFFYSFSEGRLIFGSDLKEITKLLPDYSLSLDGAYSLLTYGFMLEDLTLVNEIKKLRAGHLLILKNNVITVQQYWDFDNTTYTSENENEVIEHLDLLFRNAVKLEYEKDIEYNFEHLSTLSAGLDSRMNVWTANSLGFKNQTNLTFSKSGYIDNIVSQKIANNLNHKFLYISIIKENFFTNFEDITKINFGNCSIAGNIHVQNSINCINFKKFGLCHTGQLGDVVIGTFNKTPAHQPVKKLSGSFSNFLNGSAPNYSNDYLNNEHFMMHHRAFNGALQGNLIFQEYTEVASPFMDKDFFEYCMSIPPKIRFNHHIYLKWIKKKYPDAGNYIWEKIMAKPNSFAISYSKYYIPLSNFWNIRTALLPRIMKKISVKKPGVVNKYSMNPFQHWYNSNLNLQIELTTYFEDEKYRVEKYPEILKDCEKMFYKGMFTEKAQVVSLLSAIKYIWGERT
jgi:asparagine synthase (glutamine-hydrolysing)